MSVEVWGECWESLSVGSADAGEDGPNDEVDEVDEDEEIDGADADEENEPADTTEHGEPAADNDAEPTTANEDWQSEFERIDEAWLAGRRVGDLHEAVNFLHLLSDLHFDDMTPSEIVAAFDRFRARAGGDRFSYCPLHGAVHLVAHEEALARQRARPGALSRAGQAATLQESGRLPGRRRCRQ